jgi:hypothetical protein
MNEQQALLRIVLGIEQVIRRRVDTRYIREGLPLMEFYDIDRSGKHPQWVYWLPFYHDNRRLRIVIHLPEEVTMAGISEESVERFIDQRVKLYQNNVLSIIDEKTQQV